MTGPTRICVPEMIKYHYKNRAHLQPSLRDVRRYELIYNSGFSYEPLVFRKSDEIQIKKLIEKSLSNYKPLPDNEDNLNKKNSGNDKNLTSSEIQSANSQSSGSNIVRLIQFINDKEEPPTKKIKINDDNYELKDIINLILDDIKNASVTGLLIIILYLLLQIFCNPIYKFFISNFDQKPLVYTIRII